jgi:hypothetical protein
MASIVFVNHDTKIFPEGTQMIVLGEKKSGNIDYIKADQVKLPAEGVTLTEEVAKILKEKGITDVTVVCHAEENMQIRRAGLLTSAFEGSRTKVTPKLSEGNGLIGIMQQIKPGVPDPEVLRKVNIAIMAELGQATDSFKPGQSTIVLARAWKIQQDLGAMNIDARMLSEDADAYILTIPDDVETSKMSIEEIRVPRGMTVEM